MCFLFLVVVPIYAADFIFGVLKHCFHDYSMAMADVVSFCCCFFLGFICDHGMCHQLFCRSRFPDIVATSDTSGIEWRNGLADAFAICSHTVLCILHSCCFGDTMRKYDYREKRKNNILQDASHAE